MKMGSFSLLILFFSLSASSFADTSGFDYCFKPEKPLFFASSHYKNRYDEDLQAYNHCLKDFNDMQARLTKMQEESIANSMIILNEFVNHQKSMSQ